MEKTILVAVLYDKDNKCERVAKIYNKTEKEYNALVNEQEKHLENERIAREKKLESDKHVNERLAKLEKRDFMVAKSIYDNFVDRGLINDNEQFQRDFYDYVFNNAQLNVARTPNDFQVILRKVGNL